MDPSNSAGTTPDGAGSAAPAPPKKIYRVRNTADPLRRPVKRDVRAPGTSNAPARAPVDKPEGFGVLVGDDAAVFVPSEGMEAGVVLDRLVVAIGETLDEVVVVIVGVFDELLLDEVVLAEVVLVELVLDLVLGELVLDELVKRSSRIQN